MMLDTFVNPTISNASQLGLGFVMDSDPIRFRPGGSAGEITTVIRAIYRQVLGNAYVMESERPIALESQFQNGELSVREFVRRLAQSDLYRTRFFDNCPRYRAIELNFKHLLGRAPESYAEMAAHSAILDRQGFAAEIDAYVDSNEYGEAFGEDIVPYYRGYRTEPGRKAVGFTYLFDLFRGAASSDKGSLEGTRSHLAKELINNTPNPVMLRSLERPTDIRTLLAAVLQPKTATAESAQATSILALVERCRERAAKIAALEQKLADLSARASIGLATLSPWQMLSSSSTTTALTARETAALQAWQADAPSSSALGDCARAQEKLVSALQQQLADKQRYAALGEACLNKWRKRSY